MQVQVRKESNFCFYLNGRQVFGRASIKGNLTVDFMGRYAKNAHVEWFEDTLDVSFKQEIKEHEMEQACRDVFLLIEGLDCEVLRA